MSERYLRAQKWILVALGLLVMLLLSASGCENVFPPGSCGETTSNEYPDEVTATPVGISSMIQNINPRPSYAPGDGVDLVLRGAWEGEGPATFTWYPPFDASGYVFPPGLLPEPGGPPFVFKNISPAEAAGGIPIHYNAPAYRPEFQDVFFDNLVVTHGSIENTAQVGHEWTLDPEASAQPLPARTPAALQVNLPSADPVAKWTVRQLYQVAAPLNQANCQYLVGLLQSGQTFSAVRVPLADGPLQPETSYTLPLVFDSSGFEVIPSLTLSSGMFSLNLPLEIRPDGSAWANQHLPAAPGHTWVALGVNPQLDLAAQCIPMDRSDYGLMTLVQLDLSARPDACENCQIASYLCYDTASAPAAPAGGSAFAGLTCLGPNESRLLEPGQWNFVDATFGLNRKPGDALHLHYSVQNADPANAHTFTISSTASDLAAGWSIHPGDRTNPDLTQTISGPFEVPANSEYHIHILGTVPADTAAGSYPYRMTVTASGLTPAERHGSSLIIVSATGSLPPAEDPLPAVGLQGSASSGYIPAGQNITYTFTMYNTGATTLSGLVLTDTLPANTTYISCVGADSCAQASGAITWNLASLGANQSRSVTLLVQAATGLDAGTLISNVDYSVSTAQSVSASGMPIHVTIGSGVKIYLPILRK